MTTLADRFVRASQPEKYEQWQHIAAQGTVDSGSDHAIPRERMPQIHGHFDLTRFLDHVHKSGSNWSRRGIKPSELKPTQGTVDMTKVSRILERTASGELSADLADAPVLASEDGYILDGHQRWKAKQIAGDDPMNVLVIHAPVDQAVDMAHEFLQGGHACHPYSGYFDDDGNESFAIRRSHGSPDEKARFEAINGNYVMVKPTTGYLDGIDGHEYAKLRDRLGCHEKWPGSGVMADILRHRHHDPEAPLKALGGEGGELAAQFARIGNPDRFSAAPVTEPHSTATTESWEPSGPESFVDHPAVKRAASLLSGGQHDAAARVHEEMSQGDRDLLDHQMAQVGHPLMHAPSLGQGDRFSALVGAAAHRGIVKDVPASPGMMLASPETREGLSYPQAEEGVEGGRQKKFREVLQQTLRDLDIPGHSSNAIGYWHEQGKAPGAEPTSVSWLHRVRDFDELRYALAHIGYRANQVSVIPFMQHDDGEHAVYHFRVKGLTGEQIGDYLDNLGVPFRTIVPRHNFTEVLVYDQDGRDGSNMDQKMEKANGTFATIIHKMNGTGEYFPNGTDGRDHSQQLFKSYIEDYNKRYAGSDRRLLELRDKFAKEIQAVAEKLTRDQMKALVQRFYQISGLR